MAGVIEIEVTCPGSAVARDIARACLEARAIACANILPGVESLFRWDGKVAVETEVLLRMKTQSGHFDTVCGLIARNHPYELPAIVAVPVLRAGPGVARWVADETGGALPGEL